MDLSSRSGSPTCQFPPRRIALYMAGDAGWDPELMKLWTLALAPLCGWCDT